MRRRRRNPGVVVWAKKNPVKAVVIAFVAFGVYQALFLKFNFTAPQVL